MTAHVTARRAAPDARHRLLWLILAGYVVLALGYSISTPPYETYDERFHFAYILNVALAHGLPVQNVNEPGPWGNEGSQPPLYYLLAAVAGFWTATPDLQAQITPNPYAARHQDVEPDDNRNYFLHYQSLEAAPYHGNILALHLARCLAVGFGALAIAATYWTGLRLWPAQPAIAIGAAGFQAFIPSYIHVTASASNDAAVIALVALTLCMLAGVLYAPGISWQRALVLGGLAGLAAMAKLSALPLLPLAMLALTWAAGGRANVRRVLVSITACLAGFAAVAGWWFVRNWLLYGELLGTDTMNRIAGLRKQTPSMAELWDEIRLEVERNFWAAFGSGNIHPPDLWLLLPRALALAGLVGCGLLLVRAWRGRQTAAGGLTSPARPRRGPEPSCSPAGGLTSPARPRRGLEPSCSPAGDAAQHRAVLIGSLWMAALLISLGWWLLHVERVTGRLLFPLLTPLSLAVAVGLTQLPGVRRRPVSVAWLGLPMALLAGVLLFVSLRPAYAPPPAVGTAELAKAQASSQLVFGNSIRLWGFSLREKMLAPGGLIHVDYYWQALGPLTSDYTVFTHILGPGEQAIGGTDSVPGRGALPTRDWLPGQIYKDTMSVYLDSPPLEPVAGTVVVGWYDMNTKQPLAPRGTDGSRPRPALGQIRIAAASPPVFQPSHAAAANFGDQVQLVGYDLSAQALTLYWKARATPADGYSVFVHVLDSQGQIIAQADGAPRGGAYPVSLWQPDEIIRDPRAITLPPATATIQLGWYRLEGGERLPLVGQAGDAFTIQAKP